jgi:hypothetical protein
MKLRVRSNELYKDYNMAKLFSIILLFITVSVCAQPADTEIRFNIIDNGERIKFSLLNNYNTSGKKTAEALQGKYRYYLAAVRIHNGYMDSCYCLRSDSSYAVFLQGAGEQRPGKITVTRKSESGEEEVMEVIFINPCSYTVGLNIHFKKGKKKINVCKEVKKRDYLEPGKKAVYKYGWLEISDE